MFHTWVPRRMSDLLKFRVKEPMLLYIFCTYEYAIKTQKNMKLGIKYGCLRQIL